MESRNTTEAARIDLFVDQQVRAPDDLMDMSERAKECAHLLLQAKAPFVYGVFGPWGSGKSSFLGMVADELKDIKEQQKSPHDFSMVPLVITFNAWKYAYAEDIVLAFLFNFAKTSQCIIPSSKTDVLKDFEGVRGAIVDLVCLLTEEGMGKLPLVGLLGKSLSGLIKKREESLALLDNETTYNRVRKALRKLVRNLNDRGYRIIVLIDEIDRCLPVDVVRLMDGIRICLLSDYPEDAEEGTKEDIVYVIAMDEDYVARAYETTHNIPRVDAYEYLEKFIQFKYHLYIPDLRKIVAGVLDKYRDFPEICQSEILLADHMRALGWYFSIRRAKAVALYYAEWLRRWVYEKTNVGKVVLQTPLRNKLGKVADDRRFYLLLKSYFSEIAMIKVCMPYHYTRIAFSGQLANLVALDTISRKEGEGRTQNAEIRRILTELGLEADSDDLFRMATNLRDYRHSDDELKDCLKDNELCVAVTEALKYLHTR